MRGRPASLLACLLTGLPSHRVRAPLILPHPPRHPLCQFCQATSPVTCHHKAAIAASILSCPIRRSECRLDRARRGSIKPREQSNKALWSGEFNDQGLVVELFPWLRIGESLNA
jgi:hypothetical protein